MNLPGVFLRCSAGPALPAGLAAGLPEILWLAEMPVVARTCSSQEVAVYAQIYGGGEEGGFPLVSVGESGGLCPHFDVQKTIRRILLEAYHDGLQPTTEMRLPFNYSLLPPWIKKIARRLRGPVAFRTCEVNFPSDRIPAVVDWLGQLQLLCDPAGFPKCERVWPEGKRAVVVITHDVDTDWVFRNPDWLERICDVEESAGLRGAWYCVPRWSRNRHSERGMERLLARGCEVGCHGYSHDARWPLCSPRESERRLRLVQSFRDDWDLRGFRSEWLWRTPDFLHMLAAVFQYDTSVPTSSDIFTPVTGNGCGSIFPYRTHGGLIELPLTLPMDEAVHRFPGSLDDFWNSQVVRAERVVAERGVVMLSLHPQPHQAANLTTLTAVTSAIRRICALPGLWLARPDELAAWIAANEQCFPNASLQDIAGING